MCLRAEHDVRITNKTVLKMMREMGLRCLIRRKKKPESYSSYNGPESVSLFLHTLFMSTAVSEAATILIFDKKHNYPA